jgi:SAM-dependent methyltransferase
MNIPLIRRQHQILKKVLDLISVLNSRKDVDFLEIGCGEGLNLEFFSSLGLKGTGIDISDKAFKIASSKKMKNVELLKGDFMKQNFGRFRQKNLFFLLFVLEHIKEDKLFVEKISKLAKAKDYFILSIPAHSGLYSSQDRIAGHYRRYDRNEIEKLLSNSGFNILRIYSIGFPVSNFYVWIYNKYLKLLKKGRKINIKNTRITGIGNYRRHFPFLARISAGLLFPVLTLLLKLDFFFHRTDLGTHYIILTQKR